jgi:hypothetical protein
MIFSFLKHFILALLLDAGAGLAFKVDADAPAPAPAPVIATPVSSCALPASLSADTTSPQPNHAAATGAHS